MRILVTGAAGFVGRHLIPALIASGHHVRAALRDGAPPANVEEFRHGDLAGEVDWDRAVANVDAVVHLAGLAHATDALADERYDRINRDATAKLAQSATRAGLQRFVFVSSIRAQTGPVADHVLNESDVARPTDAYGRSKLAAEGLVLASGVPAVVLRPVLVYGRGVKGNMATLLRLAKLPVPLPLRGLHNRRSLLSVQNLASAIEHALSAQACIGQTYVVADPVAVTIPEIIAALRAGLHRPSRLVRFPAALLRAMVRIALGAHAWDRVAGQLVVEPRKLIEHGWRPNADTRRALQELVT